MEVVVYTDILFCFNYLMDLQIVFLTVIFSRMPCKLGRISMTTGLLALYGTLIFLPEVKFLYSIMGRILVSSIAVWLLIFPCGWERFWKSLLVFYLTSVGIGGVVFALAMGTDIGRNFRAVAINGQVYLELNLGVVLLGIGISYLLLLGFRKITVRNFSRDKILVKLKFTLAKKTFFSTILLDTGCELTAPGTGEGVVLISPSVIGKTYMEKELSIPIHTAGGNCILRAFYPEKISCLDFRYQLTGTPLLAVGRGEFATDGLYQGICNPEIFREINQNGGRKDYGKMETGNQAILAESLDEIGTLAEKRCLLHRRKRGIAGTPWQGRRGTTAFGTEPFRNVPKGKADSHREKSTVGGLHSQKI